MKYLEALEYVHSIPKFKKPLGNANLRRLLEALGSPQEKLKFVHVAGTNGKGSTAAMIASVLKEQGYRTGLFTSPYIEVFNERIQINNVNISDGSLSEYIWFVKDTMEKSDAYVSEFAFITAVAMVYFKNSSCDYVVLEAGMGGRHDATNVIEESVVSVITSIGLDHMEYLGETEEEIAAEKCGIIKEYGSVVSYPNTRVMPIIKAVCEKRHARLTVCNDVLRTPDGVVYKGRSYELSLNGEYQAQNAAAVIDVIGEMKRLGARISDEALVNGLKNVQWPARFEFVRDNIIIDGAHNIDGIFALKKSLKSLYKNSVVVMAMMEDKQLETCVREIASSSRLFIATELDMPRCAKAKTLAEISRSIKADTIVETDIEKAINTAINACGANELVCICGSLYLAGEAKKILKNSK